MSDTQTLSFENFPVTFQNDGYLNATAVAEHFGKRINNYLRSKRTQEYIEALVGMLATTSLISNARKSAFNENQQVTEYGFVNSEENQHTGNPTSLSSNALKSAFKENQVVIVREGAPETGGGTWLHPKLAVDHDRWSAYGLPRTTTDIDSSARGVKVPGLAARNEL